MEPGKRLWEEGRLGTELEQDKENRADKEMEASTIGYNDNNFGSFIFLYAWAMFIFKSFREVKFYRMSVQSPHTVSGKHVCGWQNDARAWGWEAVSRRAWRETAWCLALLVMFVGGLGTMPARARVTGV